MTKPFQIFMIAILVALQYISIMEMAGSLALAASKEADLTGAERASWLFTGIIYMLIFGVFTFYLLVVVLQ